MTRLGITALLIFSTAALAVAQNSELTGFVRDSSGLPVASAGATLISADTAARVSASTDTNGIFHFAPQPGTYGLEVTAAGFRKLVRNGIVLDVSQAARLDLVLEVGSMDQTVTVTSAQEELSQSPSVANVVTGKELERLPVNGRNYTRLILLMPGASDISAAQSDGTVSGTALYSVNGQRSQDNTYLLDGIDNRFFHYESPGASPPMDSLQEFRVMTNASSEFGRAAGATVLLVTKSGTRDLRGTAYEYLRNDALDANDFFANLKNQGKTPLRQNQFGVALGGPLVLPHIYKGRDKTFWFLNYEGYRKSTSSTIVSTAPTAAERLGDFSATGRNIYDPLTSTTDAKGNIIRTIFPGDKIPANRLNPGMQYVLNTLIPLPNGPGIASNYVNTSPGTNDRNFLVGRMDQHLNDRNTLFFRFLNQQVTQVTPQGFADLNSYTKFNSFDIATGWTSILSPKSVLDVRVGYYDTYGPVNNLNTLGLQRAEFLQKTGFNLLNSGTAYSVLPTITATGDFSFGESAGPSEDHVLEGVATYSHQIGTGFLRIGGDYSHREYYHDAINNQFGALTFSPTLTQTFGDAASGSSTASLLLGYPSTVNRGQGDADINARSQGFSLFAQYDWHVNGRLTLDLGARYEYFQPAYDINNSLGSLLITRDASSGAYSGTLIWAGNNPLTGAGPNQAGYGRALQKNQLLNVSPRVGLVYQLDKKTVVRSAYGIFYESTFFQEAQDERKFYPYNILQSFTTNTGVTPDTSVTSAGPSFQNTAAIGGYPQDPNKRTPYSQQWNFTVQRELGGNFLAQIGYVGSGNRHQIGYEPLNVAIPGPGAVQPRRLLPAYGDIGYGSNVYDSNYNALQAQVSKRYGNGIQLNANYTWGRSMDGQSSLAEFKTQNPYNQRADYSRSSFDIRHAGQLSFVYDLPFGRSRRYGQNWNRPTDAFLGGWSVEGIARLETGAPLNILLGSDQANIGTTYQRPNVSGDPNNGPKTVQKWFNTSVFSLPAPYTFGNAGAFIVQADGRHNADISVYKRFALFESHTLDFRAEFFNITNSVSMGNPVTTFSSAAFGQVQSATSARQIQMALRYSF